MKSSNKAYYTYKYLPFAIGFMFLLMVAIMCLSPENITYNDVKGAPDTITILMNGLIGVVLMLIPFLYMNKMVIVELSNQTIKIHNDGKVTEVQWDDVEKLKLMQAFFPPLYKLKIRDHADYFLFPTKTWGLNILFYTSDWSDMGALIKRKKRELGI